MYIHISWQRTDTKEVLETGVFLLNEQVLDRLSTKATVKYVECVFRQAAVS